MPRLHTRLREELPPERSAFRPPIEVEGEIIGDQLTDRSSPMDAEGRNATAAHAIAFGPYRLLSTQRLLLHADKPVRLGSRALDILIVLVERHGELVEKRELMARVWPDTTVVESNLSVHVAGLRRTLQDGHDGNRYVVNIPGRGYRFIAPITLQNDARPLTLPAAPTQRRHNLSTRLTEPIGRAKMIEELTVRLAQWRLLTIAGPGGIGKTTVALAVAEQLIDAYQHGVWLIDFAQVHDPQLVLDALNVAVAPEFHSDGSLPKLIAGLGDKKTLLIFDNCEHVIGPVAELAAAILRGTSNVSILTTSREPLRAEGEQLFRLLPLAGPPESSQVTVKEALTFPAVQLFVERVTSIVGEFELTDPDVPYVADICRRLDGLPLAIEFAAAQVGAFGVKGAPPCLNDWLPLLRGGQRTASPRQQSLGATLDWSYALLSEAERKALRHLAIFVGGFTLDAAAAVLADGTSCGTDSVDLVVALVTKSLVVADARAGGSRFRLLEMTRAYCLAKFAESEEIDTLRRRHADYYRTFLDITEQSQTAIDDWSAVDMPEIENIRAALMWVFGPSGDNFVGAVNIGSNVAKPPSPHKCDIVAAVHVNTPTSRRRNGVRHARNNRPVDTSL